VIPRKLMFRLFFVKFDKIRSFLFFWGAGSEGLTFDRTAVLLADNDVLRQVGQTTAQIIRVRGS
jgi:hypothetical protein